LSHKFKILVVEDDALIAMELGERLEEMGYEVLGPAMTLADAQSIAATGDKPDAALLDANLAGQSSVGVGAALAARGVPVAFCTGYDQIKNLPIELARAPILTKPVSDEKLAEALKLLLGA
jgi:CheY-like chemotaxis protein